MKRHLTCIIFLATLVAAAPAAADVTVEGTGEPAYTNSTGNTQWIRWQAPAEADAYRLHARYYRDNVQVSEVTWSPGMSGTGWLNWSGVATLEHGRQYGICVTGEHVELGVRRRHVAHGGHRRQPLVRSARHLRGQLPRKGQGGQRVGRPEVHHGGGAAQRRHHPTERRHDGGSAGHGRPHTAGNPDRSSPGQRAEGRPAREGQAAATPHTGRAGGHANPAPHAQEEGVLTADRGPGAGRDDTATAPAKGPEARHIHGLVFKDGFGSLTEHAFLHDFANGVNRRRARALYAVQGHISATLFDDRTTVAAWRSTPSWYAISKRDRTTSPALEHFLARRMKAKTIELNSGHLSLITHPRQITELILRAARHA